MKILSARFWEAAWPYLLAIAITGVWYRALCAPFPAPAVSLLGAALTAGSVLVGFLATAKAVMLGVAASEVFQRLKSAGFVGSLFRYLVEAVWFGIAFLVFSVLGFFIDKAAPGAVPLPLWYTAAWIFMGSLMLALYARITHLIFLLLARV